MFVNIPPCLVNSTILAVLSSWSEVELLISWTACLFKIATFLCLEPGFLFNTDFFKCNPLVSSYHKLIPVEALSLGFKAKNVCSLNFLTSFWISFKLAFAAKATWISSLNLATNAEASVLCFNRNLIGWDIPSTTIWKPFVIALLSSSNAVKEPLDLSDTIWSPS